MLLRAALPPFLATIIYLIVLFVLRLWPGNQFPIMQQGTLSAGIAISAYLVYALSNIRKRSKDFKDVQIIITTSALLACLFTIVSVSGLATIDRSMSVYLLTTINNSGFKNDDRNRQKLFEEWAGLSDQVDQRISEQMRLGTVKDVQGTLCLSTQGLILVKLYQTLGDFFNLNTGILSGMESNTINSETSGCAKNE